MKQSEATQRVADLAKPPVVGRRYLVTCVRQPFSGVWVPVIGPPHEDAALGVADVHYHYDYRFFTKKLLREAFVWPQGVAWEDDGRLHPYMLATVQNQEFFPAGPSPGPERLPLEERELRCQRAMPEFPSLSRFKSKWQKFQRQYRRACLSPCKVCPHRGMPLGSIAPNAAGEIVCNGHGLRWSAETGKLIMQLPADPTRARG